MHVSMRNYNPDELIATLKQMAARGKPCPVITLLGPDEIAASKIRAASLPTVIISRVVYPGDGGLGLTAAEYLDRYVTYLYLALDDGAPRFPQGSSDPMVLGKFLELESISLTGLSPSMAGLPRPFCYEFKSHIGLPQPRKTMSLGLGSTRFARHYLGYLVLDLFSFGY